MPLCFLTLENGKEEQRALADIQVCMCVCVRGRVLVCVCGKVCAWQYNFRVCARICRSVRLFFTLTPRSTSRYSSLPLSFPSLFPFPVQSFRRTSSQRTRD